MAANWIRMRAGLLTNPKVIRMARLLVKNDTFVTWTAGDVTRDEPVTSRVTMEVTKRVIVGSLLPVWASVNDSAMTDGFVPGMEIDDIDEMAGVPGMGEAMLAVEWVDEVDGGLVFRNFDEHNTVEKERSTVAKTGAQRSKEWRERKKAEQAQASGPKPHGVTLRDVTQHVAQNVTVTSRDQSREEERREEKSSNTPPPTARAQDGDCEVFPIQEGWGPSDTFTVQAKLLGIPVRDAAFMADGVSEFVAYWLARPHELRTQAAWENTLAKSLKRHQVQAAEASARQAQAPRAPRQTTAPRTPNHGGHDVVEPA